MADAMVTGRLPEEKKQQGNAVLARYGLNASQAINLLYDRLISEQDVAFLNPAESEVSRESWLAASEFLNTLVIPLGDDWLGIDAKEAKRRRLEAKGLL